MYKVYLLYFCVSSDFFCLPVFNKNEKWVANSLKFEQNYELRCTVRLFPESIHG